MSPPGLPVLEPASSLAAPTGPLIWVTLGLGGVVFAVVAGLTLYFSWRYRHRGARGEPPQIFGNGRDELIWTGLALAVLVLLFGLSWAALGRVDPQVGREGSPDLIVTGQQWFWTASYPAAGRAVRVANELHIPTGRRLLVELRSADVIHDFWVPQLARKLDAVPGQTGRLWIGADRPGTYLGACAEFCGAQHAWMRFTVVAQTPQDYAAWLAAQARPAALPLGGDAAAGAALFARQGCAACHTVRGAGVAGVGAGGDVGPDLTHFAARGILAGGVLPNTPQNLRRWLHDPQAVKPGTRMPNYRLNGRQLGELVAYLETLR